jgi:hypothetical protein
MSSSISRTGYISCSIECLITVTERRNLKAGSTNKFNTVLYEHTRQSGDQWTGYLFMRRDEKGSEGMKRMKRAKEERKA